MTTLRNTLGAAFLVSFVVVGSISAGPLKPDCDVEKAARNTAMKATVGVGGRCDPKDAAKNKAKDAAGIEDKGVVEKRVDKREGDEGLKKKAVKKAVN